MVRKVSENLKTWLKPEWLLAALLLALPFERIPSFQLGDITVRASLAIGLLLILSVWIHTRKAFWQFAQQLWPLWLFIFFSLLSALASLHPGRGLAVVSFKLFVVVLAVAVASAFRLGLSRNYRSWLNAGVIIVCILAIYQFIGELFGLPVWLTGLRPDYTREAFGFPRVQGASLEPLYFANYLLLPLSIEAIRSVAGRAKGWLLIPIYACIFLTVSRGGIAAAILIGLLTVAIAFGRRQFRAGFRVIGFGLAGLALAYIAISVLTPWVTRLASERATPLETVRSQTASQTFRQQAVNYEVGNSFTDRSKTRELAWEAFKQNPIFGLGPGNFGYYAKEHVPHYSARQTVNNLPLEILSETGLLGAGALIAFGVVLWRSFLKTTLAKTEPAEAWIWRTGLVLFLLGTAIQYQTFSTFYIVHIWTAVGLLASVSNPRQDPA